MSCPPHACTPYGFPAALVDAALADVLQQPQRPAVLAVSGLQGSGKSTLAAQVVAAARSRGLQAAGISIDDFYLTAAQRHTLAARVHPMLATRGPPGTHEVGLALEVLARLQAGLPVSLPRFDKLADDRVPQAQWLHITQPLDVVVFEGWFLGVAAQKPEALAAPINALERQHDLHARWRRYCNTALAVDYPALWQQWHRLWFLQPPNFEVVPRWRWQQEQTLMAADSTRSGMTQAQVEAFVQHYERISRHALATLPAVANRTVALDEQRRPLAAAWR